MTIPHPAKCHVSLSIAIILRPTTIIPVSSSTYCDFPYRPFVSKEFPTPEPLSTFHRAVQVATEHPPSFQVSPEGKVPPATHLRDEMKRKIFRKSISSMYHVSNLRA